MGPWQTDPSCPYQEIAPASQARGPVAIGVPMQVGFDPLAENQVVPGGHGKPGFCSTSVARPVGEPAWEPVAPVLAWPDA